MIRGPLATPGAALATAEFGATPATITAIKAGAIASALSKLTEPQKLALQVQIAQVRVSVAQAADILRTKRGRLRVINQYLVDELAVIGDAQDSYQKFYGLASPAIVGVATASLAAEIAKSAIDEVFSTAEELRYRQSILAEQGSDIEVSLQQYQMALNVFDEMVVATT